MYIKHTLKYCLRAPLRFFLFIVLISLTTFVLIIQFCIYEKGKNELVRTRQAYTVIGDISMIDDNLEDKSNYYSYRLTEEEREILARSPYIQKVDFRYNLSGKINGWSRMVSNSSAFYNGLYFKGHVLSGKEDVNNVCWELEVSIDELYYPLEIPGDIMKLQIPANDQEFQYDKLLSGATYLFSILSYNNNSKSVSASINGPMISNVLVPEDEADSLFYRFNLDTAKALSYSIDIFPITYTNDLLCIPDFFNKKASIAKGKAFSQQDYENGSKVCIISQSLAAREAVNIGDTIQISVTDYIPSIEFRNTGGLNTNYKETTVLQEQPYTVVGFYISKNNKNDDQYFSNDTIFAPEKSCPSQFSPEKSPKEYYTFKTSFVLSSPDKKYELLNDLKERNLDFNRFNITVYDQGYELIQTILRNMMDSSISLLLLCAITIILVLALLVYLFLIRRKREFALMRVMGETKHKASLIFYLGILLIGIFGTLTAGILSSAISEKQVKKAYETGQEMAMEKGIEGGTYSDAYVFDSEIPMKYLLLPILAVFVVLFIFCFIGYLRLRNKSLLQLINERTET